MVKNHAPSSLLAMFFDQSYGITSPTAKVLQAQILGYDPRTGLQEHLPPGFIQSRMVMNKGKLS
jgi:hypothetical protein